MITFKKLKKKMVKVKPTFKYYGYIRGHFSSGDQIQTFPRYSHDGAEWKPGFALIEPNGKVQVIETDIHSECKATWDYIMNACKIINDSRLDDLSPHKRTPGYIVRSNRIALGLSVDQISTVSEIDIQTLNSYEADELAIDRVAADKLAKALGIAAEGILNGNRFLRGCDCDQCKRNLSFQYPGELNE